MTTTTMSLTKALCPVTERVCPEGKSDAGVCNERFNNGFDPVENIRDFAMICCAMDHDKQENVQMKMTA